MAKKGGKRDGSKGRAISDALSANPDATAKQVQAAVAKGGLSVSLGMIAKIKGGLKASGKKKPAAAKKAPVKRKKAVAKKKKGARRGRRPGGGASMSDAIRAYMAANPSASRSQVRDGVQSQGIAVKDSLVSAVYYKEKAREKASGGKPVAKRGPGRPKKAAPAAKAKKAAPAARAAGGLSAAQLITAKGLADQLGGIAKVREALDLIEQLS
jgi:hypothetical protein